MKKDLCHSTFEEGSLLAISSSFFHIVLDFSKCRMLIHESYFFLERSDVFSQESVER